jgi:hypothetical protein
MEEIKALVDTRWEWMRRPIHGMASLIHPLWHSADLFSDNTLSEARDSYLSKVYSDEQHILIDREITMYETRCGLAFSRAMSKRRDLCILPIQWWNSYGYTTPHLTSCALRVLSQVS